MATTDLAEVTDGSRVPCTHRTTTAATEPAIKLMAIGGMIRGSRRISHRGISLHPLFLRLVMRDSKQPNEEENPHRAREDQGKNSPKNHFSPFFSFIIAQEEYKVK